MLPVISYVISSAVSFCARLRHRSTASASHCPSHHCPRMQILTGYECEDGQARPAFGIVKGQAGLRLSRSIGEWSLLQQDALPLKDLLCPFDWTREASHAWPECLESSEALPVHAGFWDGREAG